MQRKSEPLPWSAEDDEVLREAVSIHGAKAWSAIACGLPRRSSKECRARWLVLEQLEATQPEYKRASAPAAMTAHLQVSATRPPPSKPAATGARAAKSAKSGKAAKAAKAAKAVKAVKAAKAAKAAKATAGAPEPPSPQPLICRLPIPPRKSSSGRSAHGGSTLLDAHLSPSSESATKESGRRRASPVSKQTDENFEVLPPPVPNLSQQNDFARKRARLSPQAFLEEAMSPHHMSVSSVCSPSVEICDALTLTGSEQLADDSAAGSEEDRATMQIDESTAIDHNKGADDIQKVADNDCGPAEPAAFCLQAEVPPVRGGVRPSPLHCVADEYCAEDEAFLQPRTPLLLREIDADEISADPVSCQS